MPLRYYIVSMFRHSPLEFNLKEVVVQVEVRSLECLRAKGLLASMSREQSNMPSYNQFILCLGCSYIFAPLTSLVC